MLLSGDYGDDNVLTSLKRIRCHFLTAPQTGSVQTTYRMDSGSPYSVNTKTGTLNGSKFDILQQGRFHRGQFTFTGSCELSGVEFQLEQRGLR